MDFFKEAFKVNKKFTYVDAVYLSRSLYETYFGIFNHVENNKKSISNKKLFILEKQKIAESNSYATIMEYYYRMYNKKKIKDIFNLTLSEFINQPSEDIKLQIKVAEQILLEKAKEENEVAKELGLNIK